MIDCKRFYDLLIENGIDFFTGVPDSLLKDLCACITKNTPKEQNIIAANEGNAIAIATGHHLASGKIPAVYMQNSGQGNAVNPLTSLVDPKVYSIPLLMIIGWRGEPGKKDEPQHAKQGSVTLPLLKVLGIPYDILPDTMEQAKEVLEKAVLSIKERSAPYALVVRKGTFAPYALQHETESPYKLTREEVIKIIVDQLGPDDVVVSTTGKTSRELFEYREALKQDHRKDFLTVGSMGHSSSIALGIALSQPDKAVYCLDGDGALIMHMGALSIIGSHAPGNFKHIVLNNGAHASVGGQPTVGFRIDIPSIAKACGYTIAWLAKTREEIEEKLVSLKTSEGPCLLEIRIKKGARKDLGRPTTTPIENKEAFMGFLSG